MSLAAESKRPLAQEIKVGDNQLIRQSSNDYGL
jgi:hypothetical protein